MLFVGGLLLVGGGAAVWVVRDLWRKTIDVRSVSKTLFKKDGIDLDDAAFLKRCAPTEEVAYVSWDVDAMSSNDVDLLKLALTRASAVFAHCTNAEDDDKFLTRLNHSSAHVCAKFVAASYFAAKSGVAVPSAREMLEVALAVYHHPSFDDLGLIELWEYIEPEVLAVIGGCESLGSVE